jgi:hypothetical protein
MTEKLTRSVPLNFKRKAALLSRKRKKSISALFVEREAKRKKDPFAGLDGVSISILH